MRTELPYFFNLFFLFGSWRGSGNLNLTSKGFPLGCRAETIDWSFWEFYVHLHTFFWIFSGVWFRTQEAAASELIFKVNRALIETLGGLNHLLVVADLFVNLVAPHDDVLKQGSNFVDLNPPGLSRGGARREGLTFRGRRLALSWQVVVQSNCLFGWSQGEEGQLSLELKCESLFILDLCVEIWPIYQFLMEELRFWGNHLPLLKWLQNLLTLDRQVFEGVLPWFFQRDAFEFHHRAATISEAFGLDLGSFVEWGEVVAGQAQ